MSATFLTLTLTSCSNDNETSNSKSNNDASLTQREYQTNPLEYVGVEHNKFMETFMSELEKSYQNKDFDSIVFLSDEYKTQFSTLMDNSFHIRYTESTSTVQFQKDHYDEIELNEWYNGDSKNELTLAESILTEKATAKDKEFTMNLLNDVYNAIDKATSNELAFEDLNQVISYHEELILSEKWGTNEDYALGALAVAKYSTQFWKEYDFTPFISETFTGRRPNPRSSIIVGCDVAGYVVGGVTGGVGGSFAGPAGTVGGVLGGKAFGAWAGSTGAAGAIAIYDAFSDWYRNR